MERNNLWTEFPDRDMEDYSGVSVSKLRHFDTDLLKLPPMQTKDVGQFADCSTIPASYHRHYDRDLLALPPDVESTVSPPPSSFERRHDQDLLKLPPKKSTPDARPIRKVPVPNISQGLGKRQSKKDIVMLSRYIQAQMPLLVHRQQLYAFIPPCWKELREEDAATHIIGLLATEGLDDCITDSDAKSIYRRLRIEPEPQHPEEFEPPENSINFLDGTYNILENRFYDHQPEDYFTSAIDVAWEDVCNAPYGAVFEEFVEQISGGDPDVRQQILELTAILLTGAKLKYFFVLLGDSNTGKSQLGRFLSELIGHSNTETLRGINDFSEKWSAGQIAGKKLATCLDLPDQMLSDDAIGAIKQLVGDDAMKGEAKRGHPFTFYHKPLLLCAGNHALRVPKGEQAILNRLVIIPFRNPCEESQMIHALYKELLNESPYIIHEAIAAFTDFAARNFQVTRAKVPIEYQPQLYLTPSQVVEQFVEECCVIEENCETSSASLYDAYRSYTKKLGFTTLADNIFSRDLSQLAKKKGWSLAALKRTSGTNDRGYSGIRLMSR